MLEKYQIILSGHLGSQAALCPDHARHHHRNRFPSLPSFSTIKGTNEQIKQNLVGAGNNAVRIQLYQGDWTYDLSYQAPPDGVPVIGEDTLEQVKGPRGGGGGVPSTVPAMNTAPVFNGKPGAGRRQYPGDRQPLSGRLRIPDHPWPRIHRKGFLRDPESGASGQKRHPPICSREKIPSERTVEIKGETLCGRRPRGQKIRL